MEIYLVGGAVRDELLGHESSDKDYTVIGADEDRFLLHFPGAKKVGRRSCVYIHNHREYTLSHATTIQDDLESRDLTVNAFAKDESGRIYAHPRSFADLDRKLLRPIGRENFFDDPLRVYRAARFAACYPDFTVLPSLMESMQAVARSDLLGAVSAERVGREIVKAFGGPKPGNFLRLLYQTGSESPWLQEFKYSGEIPAGPAPYHDASVLEHTCRVMDDVADDPLLVWMALCHDVGKIATDSSLLPRHHRHDINGQELAAIMGQRVRLPKKYIQAGAKSARYHMIAGNYARLRPGTRVDLLNELHQSRLTDRLFTLVKADKGKDLRAAAKQDLEKIMAVHLPLKMRGLGEQSRIAIRDLRIKALPSRPS
jgi:tRNA nucleotidyltransferase (CCA-adding enzyme)